jgi:nicotinate phosphoribosyltransferase
MERGKMIHGDETISRIALYARQQLDRLPAEHRRFENPHIYKVGLSEKLAGLRDELIHLYRKEP